MSPARLPHLVSLVAALLAGGCSKCGGDASTAASTASATVASAVAPSGSASAQASRDAHDAAADLVDPPPADLPEVKDDGDGRATAALRSALMAFGIAVDAPALLRECKVDDDGASIDDLEDVAVKHGLEAGSVVAPVEHVLLPAARLLPAIAIVDSSEGDGAQELVAIWRMDGDRVLVMDPLQGKRWIPRAELQKRLHVHEITTPLEEYRESISAPSFADALEARLAAIGVAHAPARALIDEASTRQDRARGISALDAAIRKVAEGGGSGSDAVTAAFACALGGEKSCEGATPPLPRQWSTQPAPNDDQGAAQVKVRGAVLLVITGRSTAL